MHLPMPWAEIVRHVPHQVCVAASLDEVHSHWRNGMHSANRPMSRNVTAMQSPKQQAN